MCLLDFGLGDRLHDVADLRLEGRAAHQEAVDVRERRELGRVLSVRAATVLDADRVGRRAVDVGRDPFSDTFVRLLGLLRGSRFARADGPDGLVGDGDARPLGLRELALESGLRGTDAVAKLQRRSRETRGLSCGRVDGVEAT